MMNVLIQRRDYGKIKDVDHQGKFKTLTSSTDPDGGRSPSVDAWFSIALEF